MDTMMMENDTSDVVSSPYPQPISGLAAAAAAAAAASSSVERSNVYKNGITIAEEQSAPGIEKTKTQAQTASPPPGVVLHRRSRRRRRDKNDDALLKSNEKSVPTRLLDSTVINQVLRESHLPAAYAFEIPKTVHRILQLDNCQHVALQMPEGLLLYATVIADVLQRLVACVASASAAAASSAGTSSSSATTTTRPTPPDTALVGTPGAAAGEAATAMIATADAAATTTTTTTTTNSTIIRSSSGNGNNIDDKSNNNQSLLKVSILGDVTYGACCVDDLGAQALGAELLVHYGHSCLVPLQHTVIPCLYVFVEIQIDIPHMVECLDTTLRQQQQQQHGTKGTGIDTIIADAITKNTETTSASATTISNSRSMPHVYFLGTVQFRHALAPAMELLQQKNDGCYKYVSIPQVKPLSPGEVLGCTSPVLRDHHLVENSGGDNAWVAAQSVDENKNSPATAAITAESKAVVCFVADGRFHLESTMIANAADAGITFYRYDPYSKQLSTESYDYALMQKMRQQAIQRATVMLNGSDGGGNSDDGLSSNGPPALTVGIILGTLGRQGNPAIVKRIRQAIHDKYNKDKQQQQHQRRKVQVRTFVLLLSEITPTKLQMLQTKIRLWVQVACPRLSIDWGHCFSSSSAQQKQVILLSPYEFFCCLELLDDNSSEKDNHVSSSYQPPMDFYSHSGGPWSNYYQDNKDRQG